MKAEISMIMQYIIFHICVYKMPNDDSQLELKHVTGTKLIKICDVCDWFGTYTCNIKSCLFITLQRTEFLDLVAHCLKVQTFITTFQKLFLLLSSHKYQGKHLLDLFSMTGQPMPHQLSRYILHEGKKWTFTIKITSVNMNS